MCSAIDQATKRTTRGGGRSRSNCAPQEGSPRSLSSPRRGITLPAISYARHLPGAAAFLLGVFLSLGMFCAPAVRAQIPVANPVPPPPGQNTTEKQGATIVSRVNLVVLHTTVLDDRQRFADGLTAQNFRVFEERLSRNFLCSNAKTCPSVWDW